MVRPTVSLKVINQRLCQIENRLEYIFNSVCTIDSQYRELHNLERIDVLRKELARAKTLERVRKFRRKEEGKLK